MAEPAPQPSFRQRLIDIAHPLRRPLGPIPLGAVLLAIILVIVAFLAGWFVSSRLSQRQIEKKYGHSLRVFKIPPPRPISKAPRITAVPSAATINVARYPAVGDQGTLGSCAAWASAWVASFEYRLIHPKSYLRFSPRYEYDTFSRGQGDQGSWPDQDLAPMATTGIPRFKQYPYPPFTMTWPVPATDKYGHSLSAAAAKLKMPIQVLNGGAGEQGLAFMRSEIFQGHPVLLAIPVYTNFETSTGTVDVPGPNDQYYGGHEIAILAYDDTYQFPSGNVGGAYVQNQWSTSWSQGGRAWISYAFLVRYAWQFESVRLGSAVGATGAPQTPIQFPPHPTHAPPSVPKNVKVPKTLTATLWMRSGPYHRMINHAAAVNHLAPLGLSALVGTESSFQASATRCVSYADCSAGLTQVTVPTARSYGITGTTAEILAWERRPQNSLNLAGRMLADFRRICGWDWQRLYECWNEGPYRGHAAYLFPTPGYGVQAWQNYQNWTVYVYATYSRKSPGDIGPCNGCRRTKPKH